MGREKELEKNKERMRRKMKEWEKYRENKNNEKMGRIKKEWVEKKSSRKIKREWEEKKLKEKKERNKFKTHNIF